MKGEKGELKSLEEQERGRGKGGEREREAEKEWEREMRVREKKVDIWPPPLKGLICVMEFTVTNNIQSELFEAKVWRVTKA